MSAEFATNGSLAIFDLDRTLHAGSGLGVLARLAFRARLIGPGRLAHSLVHDVVFRHLQGQLGDRADLAVGRTPLAEHHVVDQGMSQPPRTDQAGPEGEPGQH
ncbi:MAG: hypothetical protein AAFN30_07590, partial [Actinomycetota bacterium]